MPKTIKEFQLNQSTGEVSVEYSDDSTSKFNAADMVTAQTDTVTGVVKLSLPSVAPLITADQRASAIRPDRPIVGPLRSVAYARNDTSASYVQEPCAIHVDFPKGVVPSADYLKIKVDGSYVAFQWEPGFDVSKSASEAIGAWSDGSLRYGYIWVLLSVPAQSVAKVDVEVYSTAQSQSFSQAVTYAVVSGTSEKLETSRYIYQFESTQNWMLRRLYDKNNSNEDHFQADQGVAVVNQLSASVTNNTYTAGHVSLTSKGVIGASAFGYGVIFQDWEVKHSWLNESGMTTRTRYRVFANGICRVDLFSSTTNAIGNADRKLYLSVRFTKTGALSYSHNLPHGDTVATYANKSIMAYPFVVHNQYESTPYGSHDALVDLDDNGHPRFGWSKTTTAAPAGAYWGARVIVKPGISTDLESERLRLRNGLCSRATDMSKANAVSVLKGKALSLIRDYCTWFESYGSNQWRGCYALALLAGGYPGHEKEYDNWWVQNNITRSAAGLRAYWAAGNGFQFIGRNAQYARIAYRLGATNLAADIHAMADFVVSVTGADGSVPLYQGWEDNYNAEASALAILASSLAISVDATRQAAFDKILARYASGVMSSGWLPYSASWTGVSNVVKYPATHYHMYQSYELADALEVISATDPTPAVSSAIYRLTTPAGQVNELIATADRNRRGAMSTLIYAAGVLAKRHPTPSDLRHAISLIDYVLSNTIPGAMWTSPSDGWGYNAGINGEAMDVRVLCDLVLFL